MSIQIPTELQTMLDAHKLHPNADLPRGLRGRVVGKLNEYAGGEARRYAFLSATFCATTIRDLREWELAALDGWLEHPKAREDVNGVITEYLDANALPDLPRVERVERIELPKKRVNPYGENIHFPATYNGMRQKNDGEIVLTLTLDASQWQKLSPLGSEWLDCGLLVAITTIDDEPIAG